MRALDSNVLLRHLLQDDPIQSPIASRLINDELSSEEPGYVSLPVLCEVFWTLRSTYPGAADRITEAISLLLKARQIIVADEGVVLAALGSQATFADALIHLLGRGAGCRETVTFDTRFARLDGVTLLTG